MTPTNPHHEYRASRVASATPMELTRMLFEGAVKAVQDAVAAHRAGDILARGNEVTRAVQILGELRFSLRRDVAPQYCDTLSGLYGYLQTRLIQAHAEKSESMLQEVSQLIQTLLDGWVGAMRNLGELEGAPAQDPQPRPLAAVNGPSPYASPYPQAAATGTENLNRSWEF